MVLEEKVVFVVVVDVLTGNLLVSDGGIFKESGVCNVLNDLVVVAVKVKESLVYSVAVIGTDSGKAIEIEEDFMNSPGGILDDPVIIAPLLPTI